MACAPSMRRIERLHHWTSTLPRCKHWLDMEFDAMDAVLANQGLGFTHLILVAQIVFSS